MLKNFLLLFLLAGYAAAQPLEVTRVIDGDTFELSDGRTVRLIGIDTPETYVTGKLFADVSRRGSSVEVQRALGYRATDHARHLVERKAIGLSFDPANVATGHRDRYGRILAYVWVLDADGRPSFMVNERMLTDGYAYAYLRYPYGEMDRFAALYREARSQGRGLWGDTSQGEATPTGDTLADEDGTMVYVTRTGHRYHRATCRFLRTSRQPLPLSEAEKKYTPCRVCHPPVTAR